VGSCLLGNCQVVLAKCLADGECLENLICLQLCNGRPDETACQVMHTIFEGTSWEL
jgi:violaxanthin de-epoxidase